MGVVCHPETSSAARGPTLRTKPASRGEVFHLGSGNQTSFSTWRGGGGSGHGAPQAERFQVGGKLARLRFHFSRAAEKQGFHLSCGCYIKAGSSLRVRSLIMRERRAETPPHCQNFSELFLVSSARLGVVRAGAGVGPVPFDRCQRPGPDDLGRTPAGSGARKGGCGSGGFFGVGKPLGL